MTYVSYDKETCSVDIALPPEATQWGKQVRDDLEAEFAFEGMGSKTVQAMNDYVRNWLAGRGVEDKGGPA